MIMTEMEAPSTVNEDSPDINISTRKYTVQNLKDLPTLGYRIHVLTHDLRHSDDPKHIGEPYFRDPEAAMLRSTTTVDGEKTL